jgi:hypothetical protein
VSNDTRQLTVTQRQRIRQILADPVQFGEVFLRNRDKSPRRYWPHQIEDLRAPEKNIVHLDGRDVGKSIDITTLALHFAVTTPGGQLLIAAPFQGQLDSLSKEIEYQLSQNDELLGDGLATNNWGQPKITRKPYYELNFQNGASIYFRPAGTEGNSFRSLHVDRMLVDEGSWLSEAAWKALRGCLKAGGHMRVYSTTNGLRDTTYYRLTTATEGWRIFRWPSWINPNWTAEREKELLNFYGGRDTAGWQHEVAGEHGRPAYGAFNAEHLNMAMVEMPEYRKVSITGNELKDCVTEEDILNRLDMLLNLNRSDGVYWMGGDTGYTQDPTELTVFKEVDGNVGKKVMWLVLRLHMEQVAYTHVTQAIALLDRYYEFTGLGLDNGGNGTAITHELLTLDKYRPQGFGERLRGFDFGGITTIQSGEREQKKRTKELMTSLISGALQRGEMRLPSEDADILDQFSTHTYSMQNGYVVYSKGHDHIVDSVRTAMLSRELSRTDTGEKNEGLVMPCLTEPVFQ